MTSDEQTSVIRPTNNPLIIKLTIINETEIMIEWDPNRADNSEMRYIIKIFNSNDSIDAFEYPGS